MQTSSDLSNTFGSPSKSPFTVHKQGLTPSLKEYSRKFSSISIPGLNDESSVLLPAISIPSNTRQKKINETEPDNNPLATFSDDINEPECDTPNQIYNKHSRSSRFRKDMKEASKVLMPKSKDDLRKYRMNRGLDYIGRKESTDDDVDIRKIPVCNIMFLNTLSISYNFVNTAICKFDRESGSIKPDRRGKHPNRPKRISADMIQSVINHVEAFSHEEPLNARKDSNYKKINRLSFPTMFRFYKEWFDPEMYSAQATTVREIISFGYGKKKFLHDGYVYAQNRLMRNVNIFMTSRGKERLIYENFSYYKQSRTRNGFRWGCTKNRWHRCRAYLHLSDDMMIVRSNTDHTHPAFVETTRKRVKK
ncbi:unnamed protein product, partial [Leptidea sinapis]